MVLGDPFSATCAAKVAQNPAQVAMLMEQGRQAHQEVAVPPARFNQQVQLLLYAVTEIAVMAVPSRGKTCDFAAYLLEF